MTAKIINLDDFRPIPTIQKQREHIADVVCQEVMSIYPTEPAVVVKLGCDAATDAVYAGKGFKDAIDAAHEAIDGANRFFAKHGY